LARRAIIALLTVFLVIGIGLLKTEFSQENMLPRNTIVKTMHTCRTSSGLELRETSLWSGRRHLTGIAEALMICPAKPGGGGSQARQVLKVETYLDGLKRWLMPRACPASSFLLGALSNSFFQPLRAGTDSSKTISQEGSGVIKLQLDSHLTQVNRSTSQELEKYFTSEFGAEGAKVYLSGRHPWRGRHEIHDQQTGILS